MTGKERLIELLKLLYAATDEDHQLSTAEIVANFAEKDVPTDRSTVKADIDVLNKCGIEILATRGTQTRYYFSDRQFELAELKLLVDAVESSKFITAKKSDLLIKKLMTLAGDNNAKELERHLYTAGRIKPENESIFYTVDIIHRAINSGMQIAFVYYEYTTDKTLVPKANRAVCRKPLKAQSCKAFITWVVKQVREHKWSLYSCCGYARLHRLFCEDEMVCTCMVWAGLLPLTPTELPEALKRKAKSHKDRKNKKQYGQSISVRPEIARLRIEEGHWEGDTVVGKRAGKEAVVLSLLEKKTETYLAFRIPAKTSEAVMGAMNALHNEYRGHFSEVFKTITVDNGSEFADFAQVAAWGSQVYFAHPYTSWERPQNERHNGLFRAFVPKGVSIEQYSDEDILSAADELNGRPRRKLGYRTPEELFDAFLDSVFAA